MIAIRNLQGRIRLPRGDVERLVRTVLRGEGAPALRLSIVFVGSGRIRAINRRFLGRDRTTDVIAFALGGPSRAAGVDGEVVVSADRAVLEARRRGIAVREELLRYVVHGVLHLLGHDDRTPALRKLMWAKQEAYLRKAWPGSAAARTRARRARSK